MKERPGFISATGVVVAAVLLLAVLAWTLARGPALFSPGPLNAEAKAATLGGVGSHAQLGGDCGACHPAPWSAQTTADRCMGCHDAVAAEITGEKGLHGGLAGGRTAPTCGGCHPEHNGPHGALTALDAATFPHDLTGFSLRSHEKTVQGAGFACADCHPKSWTPFDQALCAGCHAGIDAAFMRRHEATWGKDCLPCHDGSGRNGANFDHGATAFALTGKHAAVPCEECHADARSVEDLRGTPQDCYACHKKDDEHRGAYGKDCGQCHSAAAWDEVSFDHTVFPLDHGSEERKATCETCHPADLKSYTCYGCHEHTEAKALNEHEGRSLAELADCVRCHPGGRQSGD